MDDGRRDAEAPGLTRLLAWRLPVEGAALGLTVGLAVGGGLGGVLALIGGLGGAGDGAAVLSGMAGMLGLGLVLGGATGAATGLAAGVAALLALSVACLVLRGSGRRLTRRTGSFVVPLAVLAVPLLAVVAALADGGDGWDRLGLTAGVFGLAPFLAGTALATWRYRRLTRDGARGPQVRRGVRSERPA